MEPFITDAILPIRESGPWVANKSFIIPEAPPPDRGLIIAIGRTSPGIPINFVTGENIEVTKSIAPEALNMPMATSMATKKGIILTAVSKPSLAPSAKAS